MMRGVKTPMRKPYKPTLVPNELICVWIELIFYGNELEKRFLMFSEIGILVVVKYLCVNVKTFLHFVPRQTLFWHWADWVGHGQGLPIRRQFGFCKIAAHATFSEQAIQIPLIAHQMSHG